MPRNLVIRLALVVFGLSSPAAHAVDPAPLIPGDWQLQLQDEFDGSSQQHGMFEARIKYPAIKGLWPAFWLMPDRGEYGWKDSYYRSYVKFDLTGVNPGTINTVELKMKVYGVTGGPNGDSDHDGIPNAVEYALDLDPAGSDGTPGSVSGNVLTFHKRAATSGNSDLIYRIEVSSDLGGSDPWAEVAAYLQNDSTLISATLAGESPAKFARLRVIMGP